MDEGFQGTKRHHSHQEFRVELGAIQHDTQGTKRPAVAHSYSQELRLDLEQYSMVIAILHIAGLPNVMRRTFQVGTSSIGVADIRAVLYFLRPWIYYKMRQHEIAIIRCTNAPILSA